MKIVNKSEFESIIKDGYTLVDFFATWCGPCKMLGPVLEELDGEFPNVDFIKVDVDQEEGLAQQYNVMSIPTVFILKDGEIVAKTGGMQPKSTMKLFIESSIK